VIGEIEGPGRAIREPVDQSDDAGPTLVTRLRFLRRQRRTSSVGTDRVGNSGISALGVRRAIGPAKPRIARTPSAVRAPMGAGIALYENSAICRAQTLHQNSHYCPRLIRDGGAVLRWRGARTTQRCGAPVLQLPECDVLAVYSLLASASARWRWSSIFGKVWRANSLSWGSEPFSISYRKSAAFPFW
jgi:hypothetical protein